MVPDPAEAEIDVSSNVSLFEGKSGALRRPSFAMRFLCGQNVGYLIAANM